MIIKTSKGDLPIKYTWNALADFGELATMPMDEVIVMNPARLRPKQFQLFILAGFLEGAFEADQESQVNTARDIGDLMGENPGLISNVLECYTEFIARVADEADKVEKDKKK